MTTSHDVLETVHVLDRYAQRKARWAPTLLRWGLGLVFVAHAYAKLAIYTIPGTIAFFEANGFPGWMAYPVIATELLGGLSLLLGLHSRVAALALLPVMLGALIPHLANGWMFTSAGGGWEYVAFLLVALATQVILGDGAFAVSSAKAGAGLSGAIVSKADGALS